MVIFIIFTFSSNHLHPVQVENSDSNSRLVVDEDDNAKSGLKGLMILSCDSHNNKLFALVKLLCICLKGSDDGRLCENSHSIQVENCFIFYITSFH